MKFDNWFYEQEGFSLRCERFYDVLDNCLNGNFDTEYITLWLKSAYDQGFNDAMNFLNDTKE